MLPNCLGPIIVNATLVVAEAILVESTLSFLGFGIQPPTPSWGNLLSDSIGTVEDWWWLTVFPGLAIFLTVLAVNFVGDGLRDAFDPRRRVRGMTAVAALEVDDLRVAVPRPSTRSCAVSAASRSRSTRARPSRWWGSRARARR